MNYRAEIDGLRALAVLSVLFYHVGFELVSGGFLGVDIFFVISGYLITNILLTELRNERFSIRDFYERRARRILPALFIVILFSLPFAWFWMLPSQMKDFSQSIVSILTFSSNFLFWLETDYFSADANLKPMLHTWSLGVEEQYYIIFPLFLFFLWQRFKSKLAVIFILLTLLSLGLSEFAWRNYPSANFYFPVFRAWELLVGGLAALAVKNKPSSNDFMSAIGLFAVILSVFMYNDTIPIPSIYGLVPIIGTFLIIVFAGPQTIVRKILSYKLLAGIGLISYSTYLWHQPVIAFVKLKYLNEIDLSSSILITTVTIVLACASYIFIERPFRDKKIISTTVFYTVLFVFWVSLFSIGIAGHITNGKFMRWDFNSEQLEAYREMNNSYVWKSWKTFEDAQFSAPNNKLLIIGDSNSGDFLNSLFETERFSSSSFSTLPAETICHLAEPNFEDVFGRRCTTRINIDLHSVDNLLSKADSVFIAYQWNFNEAKHLKDLIADLDNRYGQKFWVVGTKGTDIQFADFEYNQLYALARPIIGTPLAEDIEINNLLSASLLRFINPYDWLCESNKCTVYTKTTGLLQYDGFHLTQNGAKSFGRWIETYYSDSFIEKK